MKTDELFEQKCLVASKLKECIRDKGYTKVSIASKTGIPCWILARLLNGRIDDKQTFDYYLQKILSVLNMSIEKLLLYYSVASQPVITTVFFLDFPFEQEITETAKRQYHFLLDIIDLCAIYY